MHRKDLNERSPLRILDRSIHGGLGRGNVGVVVARHGVGKSAFLVGVALDDLMRRRKVLHVSLDHNVDRVATFYNEVFTDLCRTTALEDVWRLRAEMERHRRIHCYTDGKFSIGRLREALAFLRDTEDFAPAAIMCEGYDFGNATPEELQEIKSLAREADVEVWMSANTTRDAARNERGVPEPLAHLEKSVDVILTMAHDGRHVRVGLHKDHDNPQVSDLKLALDPTTMLLIEEVDQPSS